MSSDNVARWQELAKPRPTYPSSEPDEQSEDTAPNRCYATVWGNGRAAPMIEFRLPDGTTEAFAYSWLRRVATDADRRLVLFFNPADRVIVEGHNLGKLRGLLALQRVLWIDSLDLLHADGDPGPVVTGITVEISDPTATK